jgi:hypothetical protein
MRLFDETRIDMMNEMQFQKLVEKVPMDEIQSLID